jgi:signal transduction histidine kinase
MPLGLQLFSSIVLIRLQQEAEAEAHRAIEARSVSTQIAHITSDILQLYTISSDNTFNVRWQSFGYQGYLTPQYKVLLRKIRTEYEILDKLTADKPALNQTVQRSRGPFIEGEQIIEQANKAISSGHMDEFVASSEQKTHRLYTLGRDLISQELMLQAKNEEEFATNNDKKQSEIRQAMLTCALTVNLANIYFSVLLGRFLVRTLTSRLRTVADNAVRLAAHQPLHPPLSGSDEIAELDQVFHDMALTIDETAQAKQEMFNMITHDLRTPLTAIQACLEMLAGQAEEFNTRCRKLVYVAARNSSRTIGLVNDLLDSEKLEAGMLELNACEVHLEDVFESLELDIAGWIGEFGIQITFPTTDLVVTANQDMLSRILFNLISNAVKYSPRGSTIAINVSPASNMAEITVSDQGPGIPRHMIKTVFDRFRQVPSNDEASRGGSGLGLSICQDFVRLHGGQIWASSSLGHGSTFHFTLPLA